MTVAVIINGVVDNLIICQSVELAQQLYPCALCVDAEDGVLSIGQIY